MTTRLPHLLLVAVVALLTSCATTSRDKIDDEALYRAQDKTFRPGGNY